MRKILSLIVLLVVSPVLLAVVVISTTYLLSVLLSATGILG